MSDGAGIDIDRYLERIGFAGPVRRDVETLAALQRAHLTAVPFENLDVYFRTGVRTDLSWSIDKIVNRRRGGWCFENNGAFAALLTALGFDVMRLGAAVLLGGPSDMIDHLTLEVRLDRSWLVDVGFGADGPIVPLAINQRGPQDGGAGTFEFIPSAKGLTLTLHDAEGVPSPRYRFRRVAHEMSDFNAASDFLQNDAGSSFLRGPFANRLIDGGPDRVSITADRLRIVRDGVENDIPVSPDEWAATLREWFSIDAPTEAADQTTA